MEQGSRGGHALRGVTLSQIGNKLKGKDMKVVDKFGSLYEMTRYAEKNPHTNADSNSDSVWVDKGRTKSLADAVKFSDEGWSEARPQIDKVLAEVQEQVGERFAQVSRVQIGLAGGGVHMGRYLAGRPDCMVGFRRQPSTRHGRMVRVVYDFGANGSTDAEEMLKRGAIVAVLIDTLATLGLSVELVGETTVKIGDKGTHTTLVTLHDAKEQMDINALAYAVAHPSMLRRLTFAVREMSKFGLKAVESASHGRSVPITMAKELEADVVIDRIEHGGNGALMMSDPAGWVVSTIRGLGLLD